VRLGKEAIAEKLKYELANTQALNYTILRRQAKTLFLFFVKKRKVAEKSR